MKDNRGVDLNPIPTRWRGFQFRSRLEARWAVCLDALIIKFWYEPEGFKLSGGDLYLPDFYLPDLNYYAEVKPFQLTTPEVLKCEDLAHDSRRPVVLLEGPPDFRLYHAICPYATGTDSIMTECLLDIDYHDRKYYREGRLFMLTESEGNFRDESDFTAQYRDAVYSSRGHRFGEAA